MYDTGRQFYLYVSDAIMPSLFRLLGGLAVPQIVKPPQKVFSSDARVQKSAEGLNAPLSRWDISPLSEQQWTEWMKNKKGVGSITDGAFSLLGTGDTGRTYVRQDWLNTHADDQLQKKLAHELGHLLSQSTDEKVADKTGFQYLPKGK